MRTINVSKERFPLFTSIGVEISALCNRSCHFCPNSNFKRPDEQMPNDMFYEIVAQLKGLKYKGRFEFYIYNEPTRDERLLHFIQVVRDALPSACLMINTNGDYFKTSADIKRLFDAGLNQMQINVYSANDKYDGIDEAKFQKGVEFAAKRYEMFNQWIEELGLNTGLSLYQYIGANKVSCKAIAKYGIRKQTKGYTNRSGLIPGFADGLKEPLKKYCTRPFRFLNIDWKGNGILCCNDYYSTTKMGNVKVNSLVDIWNAKMFNEYRLQLQNKNRRSHLCDQCDFNGGSYPHMINKVTFGSKEVDQRVNTKIIKPA